MLAGIGFTRAIGVNPASEFSHNHVWKALRKSLAWQSSPSSGWSRLEQGGSYAIEAKICVPADKYSNGFFVW